ncbi:mfsd1 [Nucleospora cyclopteri]
MNKREKLLAISSAALFTFYFAYDVPGAINTSMKFKGKEATELQIALLYSFYAVPNVFTPFILGKLLHNSKNSMIILLLSLISTGQLLFIISLKKEIFKYALLGRLLFGIGVESFVVFIDKELIDHFIGRELGFAMGTFNSVGRLGTVINFLISPFIAEKYSVIVIYNLSLIIVIVAVILCLYLMIIVDKNVEEEELNTPVASDSPGNAFKTLLTISFLLGCVWAPFYNIAPLMLKKRFNINKITAGRVLSCIEGASVFLQSLIGAFIDYVGYKLYLILISSILIGIAHFNFMTKMYDFHISVALLTLAAPLLTCIWPCVPKLVQKSHLSKSLGLMMCVINLAYAISPIIASLFLYFDQSYFITELYSVFICILLIFHVIKLNIQNNKLDLNLNEPEINLNSEKLRNII